MEWIEIKTINDLPKDKSFLVNWKGRSSICEYDYDEQLFYICFDPASYGVLKLDSVAELKLRQWAQIPPNSDESALSVVAPCLGNLNHSELINSAMKRHTKECEIFNCLKEVCQQWMPDELSYNSDIRNLISTRINNPEELSKAMIYFENARSKSEFNEKLYQDILKEYTRQSGL